MKLILCSQSPRRREILGMLGVPFEVRVANIDEAIDQSKPIASEIKGLAKKKALAIEMKEDEVLLSFDTVVCDGSLVMGKPKDRDEAIKMLQGYSGKGHGVITGICVRTKDKLYTDSEYTMVYFRELTNTEIEHYVDSYKPYDKAGGYGIQELAGSFVKKIDGDFYNVVGLPLCRLCEILKKELSIDLF
ncbi:MAG: septum formation protein Maf [Clostridia bacterium]|nr:septum formation protein Maf [Clostridia bacterium]